ncbi:hypothetical protein DSO57_1036473, partial [Entomophthora muscae]
HAAPKKELSHTDALEVKLQEIHSKVKSLFLAHDCNPRPASHQPCPASNIIYYNCIKTGHVAQECNRACSIFKSSEHFNYCCPHRYRLDPSQRSLHTIMAKKEYANRKHDISHSVTPQPMNKNNLYYTVDPSRPYFPFKLINQRHVTWVALPLTTVTPHPMKREDCEAAPSPEHFHMHPFSAHLNLFAPLNGLQEEQLAFDDPLLQQRTQFTRWSLLKPSLTPPSSQNSSGPLPQEVQPQGTPQTSQWKPSQLGAADMAFSQTSASDWAHITADALMLAPDISIYPNNVSMNNDDSSSDNQSKFAPVNKSLAPNLRANYQLTGFGSSSFDPINKVSSNHDSSSVSQSSQSDFGPGNNGFTPAAKTNQHPGCVGHSYYISNVNGNIQDESPLVNPSS